MLSFVVFELNFFQKISETSCNTVTCTSGRVDVRSNVPVELELGVTAEFGATAEPFPPWSTSALI